MMRPSFKMGRMLITENVDEVEVIIPSRKSLFQIIWAVGNLAVYSGILTWILYGAYYVFFDGAVNNAGWMIALIVFYGIYYLLNIILVLRSLYVKEIIAVSSGYIKIERKFVRSKIKWYDPASIGNIQLYSEKRSWWNTIPVTGMIQSRNACTLGFNYGLKTVYFGCSLEQVEAECLQGLIVEKLGHPDR